MTRPLLRPPGFDDLGVRRALSDRLLPSLVAAMTFLAALALAGAVGAAGLAEHWQRGAGQVVTVQVPQPGEPATAGEGTRLERVRSALQEMAGFGSVRVLGDEELRALLRPWLGERVGEIAVQLPAVIEAHVIGTGPDRARLEARVSQLAPGTLVEEPDRWITQIAALARSLQACAGLALAVVGFVAVAVVAVATRAGLATRRDAIETVHGLGATDSYIASRFAHRATVLAGSGSLIGFVASLPVLLGLAYLAAPFGGAPPGQGLGAALAAMPASLWFGLVTLPMIAAVIGWVTAHGAVRRWLRRLP